MEEAKVKTAGRPGKRPQTVTKDHPGFMHYLLHTLLFILKIAVFLCLFFSLQDVSETLRTVPLLNNLPPFGAIVFAYLSVHIFCIYFFIVWFGSFAKFFRRLGPTLIEIRGILVYLVVVPLAFMLVAGGLWWCVSGIKMVAFLAAPFQFLPDLFQRLYGQGMPFPLFAGITTAFLLALLFLVVIFQRILDGKPVENETQADDPVQTEPVIPSAPSPDGSPLIEQKERYKKPLQPDGQPPLHMKK